MLDTNLAEGIDKLKAVNEFTVARNFLHDLKN